MVQSLYEFELMYVSIFQEAKFFNTPNLYTTDPLFYNSSINIGYISFLSSSDMLHSHHLLGCHTTGINPSFNSFLSALHFSTLVSQAKSPT